MFEMPTGSTPETLQIFLDGQSVQLPAKLRSLSAIRTHLETLALEHERVVCTFQVNGCPAETSPGHWEKNAVNRIEAATVSLTDMPLKMLETASKETARAREAVEAAVTLVLINDAARAQELWWELARKLKEPLLTLSLLPETSYQRPKGCASLSQMRRWQLQQLAVIMRDVEAASDSDNSSALSNALESRVLPWLHNLERTVLLWRETLLAKPRTNLV